MPDLSPVVLAIDIGTTHVRAGVVDQGGVVLSYASRDLVLVTDSSGKAEHDPRELYRLLGEASRQAAVNYKDRIRTVSLSAYQLGLLALDAQDQPLTGVITLLDTRAQSTFACLREHVDSRLLYDTTGCPPLYHYPLAKIDWLRRTQPRTFDHAHLFVSVKDYVILQLLGTAYTEPSTAGATQLLDARTLKWAPAALEVAGIDVDRLPEVLPSDVSLGRITDEGCHALGVKIGTTLVPGGYDGGSVALGLGVFGSDCVVNFGTTAMLRAASARPVVDASPSMSLQTYYLAQATWLPGAAVNNAGFVLSWLRDNVLGGTLDELCAEADAAGSTGGMVMLPFLSGERNPALSAVPGTVWGMRAHHRRGHLVRAALQGVIYALCLVRETLLRNDIEVRTARVGGGAARSTFWLSMLATAFDTSLELSETSEPVSRASAPSLPREPGLVGAGMVGHTASGTFSNLREATMSMSRTDTRCEPDPKLAGELAEGYAQFKELICLMGTRSELSRQPV